jgi:hypothetical protein
MLPVHYRAGVVALALMSFTACATGKNLGHQVAANREGLAKLTVGMTKAQAVNTMGDLKVETKDGVVKNPWTAETVKGRDGAQYEVLYYVTRINPPFTPIGKFLTTPVIFKGGKYVGQGFDTLEKIEPPKPKEQKK